MNRRNDENSVVALIKALILIVFITIFFVFIAWVMSEDVDARTLPSDKRTMEEPNAKKQFRTVPNVLATYASGRTVIVRGASRVDR